MPEALLSHAPRGELRPLLQFADRPLRGFIRMTGIAGVWNLQRIGQHRRDEFERMTSDIDVCDLGFNLRHVATDALAALAGRCVMGVLLQGRRMGSVVRTCPVTAEAKLIQSHRLP